MALVSMNANHVAAGGVGGFEPQRANNALIYFPELVGGTDLLPLAIQNFPLPKQTTNALEIGHMNEMRKYAGRTTFEEMTIIFRDYVDQDVAKALWAWRKLVYDPETGNIGLARDYKKGAYVHMVGPNNQFDRKYDIIGMWPSAMDPGDMDQESDENVLINVTFVIDKVIPGDGLRDGRTLSNTAPGQPVGVSP